MPQISDSVAGAMATEAIVFVHGYLDDQYVWERFEAAPGALDSHHRDSHPVACTQRYTPSQVTQRGSDSAHVQHGGARLSGDVKPAGGVLHIDMPTETEKPLQVLVDLNRCQGYAQCCFLAPEAFELHGQEALWYQPAPDPSERDRVRAAAAACPVQAIRVAGLLAMSRHNGASPNA